MAPNESERGQGSGFADVHRERKSVFWEGPDLSDARIVKSKKPLAWARGTEDVLAHTGSFGCRQGRRRLMFTQIHRLTE